MEGGTGEQCISVRVKRRLFIGREAYLALLIEFERANGEQSSLPNTSSNPCHEAANDVFATSHW